MNDPQTTSSPPGAGSLPEHLVGNCWCGGWHSDHAAPVPGLCNDRDCPGETPSGEVAHLRAGWCNHAPHDSDRPPVIIPLDLEPAAIVRRASPWAVLRRRAGAVWDALPRRRHTHHYQYIHTDYRAPTLLTMSRPGHTVVYMQCWCESPDQLTAVTVPGKITLAQLVIGKARAGDLLSMYAAGAVPAEPGAQAHVIVRSALRDVLPDATVAQLERSAEEVTGLLHAAGLLAPADSREASTG